MSTPKPSPTAELQVLRHLRSTLALMRRGAGLDLDLVRACLAEETALVRRLEKLEAMTPSADAPAEDAQRELAGAA